MKPEVEAGFTEMQPEQQKQVQQKSEGTNIPLCCFIPPQQ
jgi:hypothetical protein